RSAARVEAHRVAAGRPEGLVELLGDARGGDARSQTARLEHQDLSAPGAAGVVEGARHARGLARPGRSLQDESVRFLERRDYIQQERSDREGWRQQRTAQTR